jgi:purine-binding chemotaxis protein CheW
MSMTISEPGAESGIVETTYVTLTLGEQLCGLPVSSVRDILSDQPITRIPLAPPDIAGSLNLRGRIVTSIDLRRRLGLAPAVDGEGRMSVVAEYGGEQYALLVDQVEEVLTVAPATLEPNPPTLPPPWSQFSSGVCRLEQRLLVLLDPGRLIHPAER